ncbi:MULTISPECIES: N-acetylmuramoyl-L-alanine amidase [unclassified Sphingomonas]|uniref:peptidoglycan recognition protein family protein n=1 Tax=unclassified Sphingomonas TaxID=196159 RepID=UPI002269B649|nr:MULTISPECIES: N-acetylmuramoyl-L-alanine amidase [unclassified Sphingomonas]
MTYRLTWLEDVLLGAGLKVAAVDGWKTRGLADAGDPKGILCHHTGCGAVTGNMPSLNTIVHGRTDLRGPLSQLALGRDGTFYLVAAGFAQHAGQGSWQGITTGNTSFIGIEAENDGRLSNGVAVEPWPEVQVDACRRGVAAILSRIGANAVMCAGHKEFALPQGRKDDPLFDMVTFRAAVAAIMAGSGPVRAAIPATDDAARPTMRRGGTGDRVKALQAAIGQPVDGVFGAHTEAAVRAWQVAHRLVPDGIVGPRCWAVLDAAN